MSLSPRIDTIEAQYKPTLMTAQTASGTVVDFPGIPSWVKKITVMFQGLSTNGTSGIIVQLGTSSGYTTSGYLGSGSYDISSATSSAAGNVTAGLTICYSGAAAHIKHGLMIITQLSGNIYVSSSLSGCSDHAETNMAGSSISLSGTLDRVRLTTINGTDLFDAGTINLLLE